ncbi:B12-binding domain-containing radical SAM protein [Chloroflexota bacterium]
MKVLLLFPSDPVEIYKHDAPLLGQAYLAAGLEKEGHSVAILNMMVKKHRERFLDTLHDLHPDIVGVTLTALTMKNGYQLIEVIKRETNAIVVAGGPQVTLVPKRVLANPLIDFIFMGEGDVSFATFVSKLEKGEEVQDIPGLGFGAREEIILNSKVYVEDLDSLPFPAWHLFDFEDYREEPEKRHLPILTSRGCPYKCIYCTEPKIGGSHRVRSAENVVEEIEYDMRTFNIRLFDIFDDTFIVFPKRTSEICDIIIDRNLNIKWEVSAGVNAQSTNYELFKKMRQAGCNRIGLGVESSSDEVLKLIQKPATRQQIEDAIRNSKRAGLFTTVFIMSGLPGSTYDIEMENIEFFKKLDVDRPSYGNTMVYPNTELYEWVKQNATPLVDLDTAAENFSQAPPLYQLITELPAEKLAYIQPVYETEDFPRQERVKALMKACIEARRWEFRKGLQSKYSKRLGLLMYYAAQIEPLRMVGRLIFRLLGRL